MIKEEDRERIFAIMNYHWNGVYSDRFTAADIVRVDCVKTAALFHWQIVLGGDESQCVVGVQSKVGEERLILHRNTDAPKVLASYEDYEAHGLRPPHCDPRVLHAPGVCDVCDKYAGNAQRYRTLANTSFTGQTDNRWPCPADVARPGTNQIWIGNQPYRSEPDMHDSMGWEKL